MFVLIYRTHTGVEIKKDADDIVVELKCFFFQDLDDGTHEAMFGDFENVLHKVIKKTKTKELRFILSKSHCKLIIINYQGFKIY